MPDINNAAQNAGSVAKGIGDARNQRNINRENNSPSRKGPGYTQKPPDKSSGNKGIESMRAKSASGQQSATQSTQNKGILSFQSRASGQSSSASKGSSSGASKGGQSR
jgi:hypothetical protein